MSFRKGFLLPYQRLEPKIFYALSFGKEVSDCSFSSRVGLFFVVLTINAATLKNNVSLSLMRILSTNIFKQHKIGQDNRYSQVLNVFLKSEYKFEFYMSFTNH